MSKFNRKTQQLQSRVQFVRGRLSKDKGGLKLTDQETDDLSDEVIADMIAAEVVEPVDREDAEAAAAQGSGGDDN